MLKLSPLLFAAVLLTGCASNDALLNVVSATTDVKYYYTDAREFVTKAEFDEDEQIIVDESIAILERSKKRLENYPIERVVTDLPLIALEFADLRSAYMELRAVVIANQSEYGGREWLTLARFDAAADVLDRNFKELVEAQQGNAALLTALRLADTTIKLAALL